MASDLITSASNPLVRRVRALGQRRTRAEQRAAVVEGVQPVRQAAEAGVGIERLLVAPDLLNNPSTVAFVAEAERSGTPVARFSAELFGRLSGRDGPSGLAAIVTVPESTPEQLFGSLPSGACAIVAVDRLANPGNLGTIVRTADATGTAAVVLLGATADPWDPVAIKASMGAVFHIPIVRLADLSELVTWGDRAGLTLVTTAGRAAESLWGVRLPDRVAVVLGSERDGLSDDDLASAPLAINIPMAGHAESLNVAVAAGILLHEVFRTHHHRTLP